MRRAGAPTREIRYRFATRVDRLPATTGALLARLLEDIRRPALVTVFLPAVAARDEKVKV